MNKKVKNATPKEWGGIKFKSILETTVYRTLVENGFEPKYEERTFDIFPKYEPNIPFYTKNDFKKLNKKITKVSDTLVLDSRSQQAITYTPDFMFDYKGRTIVVEVKGFQNELYPYKMKMFRKYLESCQGNYEIWEIYSKKQLTECINLLKNEI